MIATIDAFTTPLRAVYNNTFHNLDSKMNAIATFVVLIRKNGQN